MVRPVSLLPALAVVAALVGLGGAPATAAAPASAHRAATEETPLAVTIDSLTPSVIPRKGEVRVTGSVTNRDTETWRDVHLYAFASDTPMTTTAELADAAETPENLYVGARILYEGTYATVDELAPGETAQYSLSIPRRYLPDEPGVYWFGVHALGFNDAGGDSYADGRARTFLPLVPHTDRTVDTALVVPVRHRVSHAADGSLRRLRRWTTDLSSGGSLSSLVGLGAAAGSRAVSWLVDPSVVDAARRIAAGNPPRSLGPTATDGPDDDSSGSPSPSPSPSTDSDDGDAEPSPVQTAAAAAASSWLRQLRTGVAGHEILTLPYGDVDVAASAQHDPSAYQDARARSDEARLWGRSTSPAVSSPDGYLDARGISLTSSDTTVLVTDKMLGSSTAPAVIRTADHTVGVTSSGAVAGGPGPDDPTTTTAMRQRIVSEAAVRVLSTGDQPLIAVLPATWNPDRATDFWEGLDLPWLHLTTVSDAMQRPAVDVPSDGLDYPDSQQELELGESSFTAAHDLARAGDTLQNLLTQNNTVASEVSDEALTDLSYSSRSASVPTLLSARRSRAWIDTRLGSVHVDAPKAVILASGSGRFAATVINDLDESVSVRLRVKADPPLRVVEPKETIELGPGSRTTVLLSASSSGVGIRTVTLSLTDVDGRALGSSDEVPVRSNRVSKVIWLIIGTGVALLFGAIVVRLFRRVRAARRSA